ncbi:ESF1 homolog [Uloborus diversus]|uniref:ESF1 homolog n=1 Tax=Uloborus diversus TaxID=327109 RepID=UPI00240911AE|nr:ESF1 homolog [Uloborus diversus]
MDEVLKDERFNHILTDPRFRKIPRNVSKIKIDKRFKNMFKDGKFKGKSSVDKRGRQLNLTSSENLKKLYNITSESSSEDEESSSSKSKDQIKNKKSSSISESNAEQGKKVSKLHNVSTNLESQKLSSSDDDNATETKSKKQVKKNEDKNIKNSSVFVDKQKVLITKIDESSNEKLFVSKSCVKNISKSKERKEKDDTLKKSNHKSIKSLNQPDRTNGDERFQLGDNFNVNDSHIQSSCSSLKKKNHSSLKLLKNIEDDDIYSKKLQNVGHRISNSSDEDDCSDSNNGANESSEDSSDTDSESDDANENEDFDHHWEELNEDAPDADQITKRLAVCNMDWDRIRAVDLMSVFNSFKPSDGCIYSVKIYPSDYGLKRMEEERLHGPPELVEKVLGPDEEEKEDKKGQRYNREKLRQYQINRLKYYYAVVETDSPETANSLYEQLNGMEYESCSVRFDLRFIPDDVTFDQEPISAEDKVPDPTEYKPRLFVTTALQQVKVNLTWDETDPKRRETLQKAFTEPDSIERDIKDYLASSSGESEDETEKFENNEKLSTDDRIAKYKALLQSLEEKEKNEEEKYEMEITWDPGLKEKTEEIVKEKLDKDNLNPFEEMLKKKKEKIKLRKKGKKIEDEGSDESSGEESLSLSGEKNMKNDFEDKKALAELALMSDAKKIDLASNKKKKRNKNKIKTENLDDFQCNVNDPRFSAIYSSHLYNIDPSDPHFKSTPGNMALLQEKQKKFKNAGTDFEMKNAKRAKHKI